MTQKNLSYFKKYRFLAVILFIIAYTLTIPIRDYSFLEGIFDMSQGVPILAHLMLIVIGGIVLLILLKIIGIIIKR